MRATPVLSPRALDELSTEVDNLLAVVEEQQEEINRLAAICESKFTLEMQTSSRYAVYTTLIDKDTLKPIGIGRGNGVVAVPTLPFMLVHEASGNSALLDSGTFSLSEVDDVMLPVPYDIHGPWVGMFDVITHKLIVVYKFTIRIRRGEQLTVTFKSKMGAW